MENILIDQLANAIGTADIGAAWTVADYPESVATERYRKLAVAVVAVLEKRHRPILVLASECGIGRDTVLQALDLIVLRSRPPEEPLTFMLKADEITAATLKMLPIVERPREDWRRGFPRHSR